MVTDFLFYLSRRLPYNLIAALNTFELPLFKRSSKGLFVCCCFLLLPSFGEHVLFSRIYNDVREIKRSKTNLLALIDHTHGPKH